MPAFSDVIPGCRGRCSYHAQNIFVEYFIAHENHQNYFSNYRGKQPKELPKLPAFSIHTSKVLSNLLDIAERTGGDVSKLGPDAVNLKGMPQHHNLKVKAFQDLFDTIIPYLKKEFPKEFSEPEWKKFGEGLVVALAQAGMK